VSAKTRRMFIVPLGIPHNFFKYYKTFDGLGVISEDLCLYLRTGKAKRLSAKIYSYIYTGGNNK
jgi:hypothetical protein